MMLNKDFKEFAGLFRSRQVEYLMIVGGYALAAYGHPRFTGDLDFWIGTDDTNARRVARGFGLRRAEFKPSRHEGLFEPLTIKSIAASAFWIWAQAPKDT